MKNLLSLQIVNSTATKNVLRERRGIALGKSAWTEVNVLSLTFSLLYFGQIRVLSALMPDNI